MISKTLQYDFGQEKTFGEGNTRTTAVFAMKYMQLFGFEEKNDMFKEHSWYFRNAGNPK